MDILKLFTEHPATVNESYLKHMWFAIRFSFQLALAAIAALIHAFLPFLFLTTASRAVMRIQKFVDTRGN